MKKIICIFVVSLLMIASLTVVQAADSFLTINGFTFYINESGEAVIHEYDDRETDVVIPDRLLGAPVVRIEDYAFFADETITSVSYESATGLRSIGDCAFYGCTEIKSLTLCSSIEEIGFGAFQNCTGLKTVDIENGLTEIPEQAFFGDTALNNVSIPESVTGIGANAFSGCPSLRKIIIGRNVDSISNTAFQGSRNTVIHCYYDSYAHNYAKENNIPFVLLDGAVLGDVDRDGFVSINDVTAIQRHLAELEELSDLQKSAADVNGDGIIDISDATNIQLFLAEYDIPYPIGETITQ